MEVPSVWDQSSGIQDGAPRGGPQEWCRHASNGKVIAALSEVGLPAFLWHMGKIQQRDMLQGGVRATPYFQRC